MISLLAFTLLATTPIGIESNHLTYEKGTLLLEGEVKIEHELATLSAGEARLPKKGDMRLVELHQAVKVAMADGSELTCWHAYLDPVRRVGRFSSFLPLERVHYREAKAGAGREPISLTCHKMDVRLSTTPSLPSSTHAGVTALFAQGAVEIDHGTNFQARARRVHYQREAGLEPLPLHLVPRYLVTRSVSDRPDATPSAPQIADLLCLQGDVDLQAVGIGRLENNREVWLVRTEHANQPEIDCISALGHTLLISDATYPRLLECNGHLFVDQRAHKARLDGGDVVYEDAMGGFTAQSMEVNYITTSKGFEPTKILLRGDVQIRNHALGDQIHIQYALADEVEYHPATESMTLSAAQTGRVLFLDQFEDTRVSAKKVIVNRKERTVKGVGRVRFSLSEGEIGLLQELFEPE